LRPASRAALCTRAALQLFGKGPELDALVALADAVGIDTVAHGQDALSLGRQPAGLAADPWTALVLLFHDHEWEQAILDWAIETPAFYIGAQGGFEARRMRIERLAGRGVPPVQQGRVRSPVGVITHSREPGVLALSVLAEIVGEYEALHPHGWTSPSRCWPRAERCALAPPSSRRYALESRSAAGRSMRSPRRGWARAWW
jgi:xanthine/CO dehydrogenase XdhC/CoxF family maturation factor